jgi:hypothetical protein
MSDVRPQQPEHLARYLDKVRASYPYGIPSASIRVVASSESAGAIPALVSFIVFNHGAALSSEQEALLDSIATKGLKVSVDQTYRCSVASESELRAAIEAQVAHNGVVVVLGAEQQDGRSDEIGAALVLYSHALADIAANPAVKRVFWGHLQTVMRRIF